MQSIYWGELLESMSIEGVKETGLCRESSWIATRSTHKGLGYSCVNSSWEEPSEGSWTEEGMVGLFTETATQAAATPVFLPGDPGTEEPGRLQSTGLQDCTRLSD